MLDVVRMQVAARAMSPTVLADTPHAPISKEADAAFRAMCAKALDVSVRDTLYQPVLICDPRCQNRHNDCNAGRPNGHIHTQQPNPSPIHDVDVELLQRVSDLRSIPWRGLLST